MSEIYDIVLFDIGRAFYSQSLEYKNLIIDDTLILSIAKAYCNASISMYKNVFLCPKNQAPNATVPFNWYTSKSIGADYRLRWDKSTAANSDEELSDALANIKKIMNRIN